MKRLTITLTLILLISGQLLSQVWPVRVVTTLIPPYPTKIYGYTDGFTENMKVMVFLNDFSKSNYKVKLRLVIEGNGIKITNPPSHTPNPIYINGGIASNFSGYDLRDYFHSDNLVVSGMSRRSLFNSGGRLPEGFYRIGWQVYDYNRNVPVSDVGSFSVWLMLNDPPELIMPRSDATVELVGVQNIVFNWMAQHLGSPNSSGITDYTFELFEKQVPSYSPLTIVNSTRPVYTETTNMTTLILDEGKIMLHPGFDYVWRVRASEKDGKDVFKNKGYSSLRQFKFRLKCDEPMSISSKVHTDKMATISWAPPASADKYIVEYKASHEDVFRKQETEELEYEFTKLQPDTKYEYRLSSVCGNFTGKTSPIYNFKTEVAEKRNYKCGGNLPEPGPTNNTTPLKNLYPGDSFMGGGGFMIKVVKVSGSDGVFSGDGYVIMPWFNFAKMQCLWKNIKVNTDFRLFEGTVEVVSAFKHPNYPKLDLSLLDKPVTREEEKNENDVLTSTVKSVETAVDSVYITEDGDVMISTPDGEPQSVPLKEGESVAIREKDGTTHVVKDGKVTTFSKEEYEHLYSKGTNRPFGEKAEKDSVESHDHLKYLPDVVFKPYEKMFFGFDKYKYPQVKNKYKTETIKGQEYTLPYKSVSKDGFEHVLAVITLNDTITKYSNVKFYTDTDAPVPKYPTETDSIKKLLINQPCKWIGAYYHYTDTTGEEHKYLFNKLMVKRYDRKSKDIVLVSVNGCSFPPNPGQTIPKLFDQAVADVNIEKITKFEVPRFEEQKFTNTGVSRLRDYNKDMKYLIKRFKKSFKVDRKKHYLFFISNVKDPSVSGYWPFKERYGFVFTNNSIPSLAAHEIGHGVFRLEHPSEEYKIPNASDNLMYKNDARGSKLIMPQWDFLNDPPFRIYWFKKEEDQRSVNLRNQEFMGEFFEIIEKAYHSQSDIEIKPEYEYFDVLHNSNEEIKLSEDYNDKLITLNSKTEVKDESIIIDYDQIVEFVEKPENNIKITSNSLGKRVTNLELKISGARDIIGNLKKSEKNKKRKNPLYVIFKSIFNRKRNYIEINGDLQVQEGLSTNDIGFMCDDLLDITKRNICFITSTDFGDNHYMEKFLYSSNQTLLDYYNSNVTKKYDNTILFSRRKIMIISEDEKLKEYFNQWLSDEDIQYSFINKEINKNYCLIREVLLKYAEYYNANSFINDWSSCFKLKTKPDIVEPDMQAEELPVVSIPEQKVEEPTISEIRTFINIKGDIKLSWKCTGGEPEFSYKNHNEWKSVVPVLKQDFYSVELNLNRKDKIKYKIEISNVIKELFITSVTGNFQGRDNSSICENVFGPIGKQGNYEKYNYIWSNADGTTPEEFNDNLQKSNFNFKYVKKKKYIISRLHKENDIIDKAEVLINPKTECEYEISAVDLTPYPKEPKSRIDKEYLENMGYPERKVEGDGKSLELIIDGLPLAKSIVEIENDELPGEGFPKWTLNESKVLSGETKYTFNVEETGDYKLNTFLFNDNKHLLFKVYEYDEKKISISEVNDSKVQELGFAAEICNTIKKINDELKKIEDKIEELKKYPIIKELKIETPKISLPITCDSKNSFSEYNAEMYGNYKVVRETEGEVIYGVHMDEFTIPLGIAGGIDITLKVSPINISYNTYKRMNLNSEFKLTGGNGEGEVDMYVGKDLFGVEVKAGVVVPLFIKIAESDLPNCAYDMEYGWRNAYSYDPIFGKNYIKNSEFGKICIIKY